MREKRVIYPPCLRNKERCRDANFTSQDSWSSVAGVECVQMCKQNSNKEGIANCGHFQLPFPEVVHDEMKMLDVFCLRRQTNNNPCSEVILQNIYDFRFLLYSFNSYLIVHLWFFNCF